MTTVRMPTYTIGEDVCDQFSVLCRTLGKRPFFIGGAKAFSAALPTLRNFAEQGGMRPAGQSLFGEDCTFSQILSLVTLVKASGADLIVGVGGGKALDTAKCTAWELGLPVVTVPTIAATCAATTALAVVYREDNSFERFYFHDAPPDHALIDTAVIAAAPECYLRAGMGDALGKHYESKLSARGDCLNHSSALGVCIAELCLEPLLEYGVAALQSCREHQSSEALRQAVLTNIVSTGLVSLMVDDCYNCAVAHSLFYGLARLPGFEEQNLHGDAVAYGVLVQLCIDQKAREAARLRTFLKELGCPTCLDDLGVAFDREAFSPVLIETLAGPDMEHLPYPVTEEMLWQGICAVEAMASNLQIGD